MLRPQPLSRAPELPVTAGLAGLTLAVGFAQVVLEADISRLYLTEAAFWQEPWRLLTCILPHGDPLHLAFNLYWLWVFGAIVETHFGHLKTMGMVVAFAVGSGAAQYATGVGGIGLSGVGYGLFGLLFALSRKDRRLLGVMDDRTVKLFVIWFFFCIGATYAKLLAIANVAHGMGAFLGVGLGLAVANPSHGWPAKERWVPMLGAIGVLAGSVLPVVAAWKYRSHFLIGSDGAHEASVAAKNAFDEEDYPAALEGYQKAAELEPEDGRHWFNVGVAHARLSQFAEAAKAHEKAYDLNPSDNSYREAYVSVLLRHGLAVEDGDPALAEAIFERLTTLTPKDAMVWSKLAMLREGLGDTAGAKAARDQATVLAESVEP